VTTGRNVQVKALANIEVRINFRENIDSVLMMPMMTVLDDLMTADAGDVLMMLLDPPATTAQIPRASPVPHRSERSEYG
jgi:hypothetical protein